MQVYLLTDHEGYTEADVRIRGTLRWGEGVTFTTKEMPYFPAVWRSHVLASFLYAAYLDVPEPHLWAGEGEILAPKRLCTIACRAFTASHLVPMRAFTAAQRVYVALHAGLQTLVSCDIAPLWAAWAHRWLTRQDRSWKSAQVMADHYFLPFSLGAATRAAMWAAVDGEEQRQHNRLAAQAVDWALHEAVFDIFGLLASAVIAEPD